MRPLSTRCRAAVGTRRDSCRGRISAAYAQLRDLQYRDGITSAELDTMCFGEPLRHAHSIRAWSVDCADRHLFRRAGDGGKLCCSRWIVSSRFPSPVQAGDCTRFGLPRLEARAAICCTSPIRPQPCGIWHRISAIPTRLTFSHSIRRFYGLMPRAIFFRLARSRDLSERPGRTRR